MDHTNYTIIFHFLRPQSFSLDIELKQCESLIYFSLLQQDGLDCLNLEAIEIKGDTHIFAYIFNATIINAKKAFFPRIRLLLPRAITAAVATTTLWLEKSCGFHLQHYFLNFLYTYTVEYHIFS